MKRVARLLTLLALASLAVVTLSACAPPQVTFFPTLKDDVPLPGVQVRGKLVVIDGCLRLRSLFPTRGFVLGPSRLVIWPYGYSIQTDGGTTTVLDAEGRPVARVGDVITGGGGRIPSRQDAEAMIGQSLPARATGPYEIVWLHPIVPNG